MYLFQRMMPKIVGGSAMSSSIDAVLRGEDINVRTGATLTRGGGRLSTASLGRNPQPQ